MSNYSLLKSPESHHVNYYTLYLLKNYLAQVLKDARIEKIISQQKDEMVFCFKDGLLDYLRVSVAPTFSYVLPDPHFKPKTYDVAYLMKACWNQRIKTISLMARQRILIFQLQHHAVVMKLFGTHSNVLLVDENKKVVDLFRQKLKKDWEFTLDAYASSYEIPEQLDEQALKRYYPTLTPAMRTYLLQHQNPVVREQVETFIQNTLLKPPFYVGFYQKRPYFLLWNLPWKWERKETFNDLIEALRFFVRSFYKVQAWTQLYQTAWQQVQRQLQYHEKKIKSLQRHLQQLNQWRKYQRLGDLLLTYLHDLEGKKGEVQLWDYEQNQYVTVHLDERYKITEQAQRYYERSKRLKARIAVVEEQLKQHEAQRQWWQERQKELEQLSDYKTLKRWYERYCKQSIEEDTVSQGYEKRWFQGWEIYIGKHAKGNDALYRKMTKESLWFHVKDGKGAHVWVANPGKRPVPKSVQYYAAQLAAAHSDQKGAQWVRVQCSKKKHLRKSKKLPPGTLLVLQEETLLVEPWQENA